MKNGQNKKNDDFEDNSIEVVEETQMVEITPSKA
jgi:hypothetical protein